MSNVLLPKSNVFGWLLFGGEVFGALTAGFLILLYIFQNNLLYIPRPPGFPITPDENPDGCRSPGEWNTRGKLLANDPNNQISIPFEENFVTTSDNEKLHTWLLLQPESVRSEVPTLIYFHGNAANMGFRLQNAAEMFARIGINILMMDYRGYGKSTGQPSERGLELDAEAVLHFAASHPRLSRSPLVVFGRSLGGAVSISLAHKYIPPTPTTSVTSTSTSTSTAEKVKPVVSALILENTFESVPRMVDVLMPYVSLVKHTILRINWDSIGKIPALTQPILFISGDSDELVPPSHMKRLYEAAKKSSLRDFLSVFGGQHNDTWIKAGSGYYKRIKDFLVPVSSGSATAATASQSGKLEDEATSSPVASLPTMGRTFTVQ